MRADSERLRALVEEVGRFYIRDRAMTRAQRTMTDLLAKREPNEAEVAAYLAAVRRYFAGFEQEARDHLREVESRLARVSQVQFNLAAERGVAARRVAATQGVLSRVAEIDAP
jgi:hypothetical protein